MTDDKATANLQSLKVAAATDSKVLAGAIANAARQAQRVQMVAIGAGSVNQAVKGIAIARQYIEQEGIDLVRARAPCRRPAGPARTRAQPRLPRARRRPPPRADVPAGVH